MSRFYEILKEANRQNSLLPEDGSELEHKSPGEKIRVEAVPPHVAPPRTKSVHADPLDGAQPVIAPSTMEKPPVSAETSMNGAVAVHAALDRRAPVLPHVADTVVLEQYRRLRTKLLQEREINPFRILMVGSPNPQEGKTVTAFNLALSFAMLPSCKVLLVDGDLRKGSLGKWLTVNGPPGLSDLIEGTAGMQEVILKSDKLPIHFVLSGNSKISAAELLNSPRLKQSFQEMAEAYDLVVLDSPPLGLVTDAQLLASCSDAIILVGRAFSTTCKALEKTVQDLKPYRILGTVLNGGSRVKRYRRYHGYY